MIRKLLMLAALLAMPVNAATVKSGDKLGGSAVSTPAPVPTVTCPDGSVVPVTQLCAYTAPPPVESGQYQELVGSTKRGSGTFTYASGAVDNTSISYVKVDGADRVIETPSSTQLTNAKIDHVIGTNLHRGLGRFRNANGISITNSEGTFQAAPATSMTYLPAGLQFEGTVNDVTVNNVRLSGFQLVMSAGSYWNGDAINDDASSGVNHRFTNIVAFNNTDAGLDLKGKDVYLDNVTSYGNCRNIRLWHGASAGTIIVGQPIKRGGTSGCYGLWLHSMGTGVVAQYVIDNLVVNFSDSKYAVIGIDNKVNLTIKHCDVSVPAGTKFISGGSGSIINLDASCHS